MSEELKACPLCDSAAKEMAGTVGCSARRTATGECGFFHMDHWLPVETWNALPRRPSAEAAPAKGFNEGYDAGVKQIQEACRSLHGKAAPVVLTEEAKFALKEVERLRALLYPVGNDRAILCQAAVVLADAVRRLLPRGEGEGS